MIDYMTQPLSGKYNIHHGSANGLIIKFGLECMINKAIKLKNYTLQNRLTKIRHTISCNTWKGIG